MQVIERIKMLKNDYDDIFREVIPTDLLKTYDLFNASDIKSVKNYLKKAFKRLGVKLEK